VALLAPQMSLQTWEFQLGKDGVQVGEIAVVWAAVPKDEQSPLVRDLEASV
jgi:hypothetical protein